MAIHRTGFPRLIDPLMGLAFSIIAVNAMAQADVSVRSERAPLPQRIVAQPPELVMDPNLRPDVWVEGNTVRWAAIDSAPLLAEDRAKAGQPVPQRVGIGRTPPEGPIAASRTGNWTTLADGSSLWTLRLQVSGAKAVRVRFSSFGLPAEAVLRVRGEFGQPDVYAQKGPNSDGAFWAAPTPGETVYLEYQGPAGSREPLLEIAEISHFYRDPGFAPIDADDLAGDGGIAGLLPCHQSVMCHPVDANARDAVGLMFFDGGFTCTGALLNDVDPNTFAGYFLTANHCISTQASANSLTVYWLYQPATCGGSIPSLATRPKSLGAKLLANSSQSDFSFLRLNSDPNFGQGFAAWTTALPTGTVQGIHHPGGTYKRYSSGPVTSAAPICGALPTSRFVYNDWTTGITEGGSSGSPLFNSNWEVVGQLYGACYFNTPGCNNPQDYNNVYGRFSFSYSSFSSYLNAIIPDDEYEDNDSLAEAPALEIGLHALRLVDFDDYFKIDLASDADVTVSAGFNVSSMNLDLQLLNAGGAVVASSSNGTGNESLTASVMAGVYYVRALKVSAWGGDYSLNLSAFFTNCTPPSAAIAEQNGLEKNRFLSLDPSAAQGTAAIRVRLTSLHHPDPPNNPGNPAPDFSAFEGQDRWIGPPSDHTETTNPPATFRAASLQCAPYYADWSTTGLLHLFGSEVLPSSTYEITLITEGCDPGTAGNFSAPLIVKTGLWGDVAPSFQLPSPAARNQPDFGDISALVDKFKAVAGAPIAARAILQPNTVNPGAPVSFSDISSCVDAFKGLAYPYPGPANCP